MMETMQPTLRLGRDVWDREAMPPAEFAGRADRLRTAMRRAGLDALLLYGRGMNHCGHPTWISNYIVKLPFSALVVLPASGEPSLMFEGATRGRSAAAATTWIEDVRPCWAMASTCLDVLAERGLLSSRIGTAGLPALMPYADWATLSAGLARASIVDADDVVWRERAVKSPREQALIARATQIALDVFQNVESMGPVPSEAAMAAAIVRDARRRGAEDIRLMIATPGDVAPAFRPPDATPLHDGDSRIVHLAVSWSRYWSEATRTCVVRDGRLGIVHDEELETRVRQLGRSMQGGQPAAEWRDAARELIGASESQLLDQVGYGHGIGITPVEPPFLDRDDTRFEAGMCVVVRAAARASGGLRADTFVVY